MKMKNFTLILVYSLDVSKVNNRQVLEE